MNIGIVDEDYGDKVFVCMCVWVCVKCSADQLSIQMAS